MKEERRDYTVEVRKVANSGAGILYVLMGRSGLAYQCERMELEDYLFTNFVVPMNSQIIDTIIKLAEGGFAVRYYDEERRVSVDVFFPEGG